MRQRFAVIGAICGGLVFFLLAFAARVTVYEHVGSWWDEAGKYLMCPAAFGVMLGSTFAWAVGISLARPQTSRKKLIMAWGVLGGFAGLLAGYLLCAFGVFAGGWSLNPVGHGRRPGFSGVMEGLIEAAMLAIFVGLLAIPFGAIVGSLVGLVKWRSIQRGNGSLTNG